jgi:hypothetical protein
MSGILVTALEASSADAALILIVRKKRMGKIPVDMNNSRLSPIIRCRPRYVKMTQCPTIKKGLQQAKQLRECVLAGAPSEFANRKCTYDSHLPG